MTALSSIVGQALLGWLLADLVTGLFHWWEDRCGRADWPLLGQWLIAPNRLHHVDPMAFTRHGFVARNGASIAAALAVGALGLIIAGPSVLLAVTVIGGAIANEVHFYAHRPSCAGQVLRVLQQTGVIQSPKGHAAHHRPPHQVNYCVLTDWLNPTLEAVGLWRELDRIFVKGAK
jgi:hypothetical protein